MRFVTIIAVIVCLLGTPSPERVNAQAGTSARYSEPRDSASTGNGQQLTIALLAVGAIALIAIVWIIIIRRNVRTSSERVRHRLEGEAKLEAHYRDLFESASDAVFTLDAAGLVTAINPAGRLMTGLKSGDSLLQVVSPQSREPAHELLACQATLTREIAITNDKGLLLLEISVRQIVGGGVHAIARDLTQRHRLEAELRQSQKMEAISQLSGGVAHDFNNLLTVINGNAEFLRQRASPTDSEFLDEIIRAGEQAAAVTRQLLAFSRKSVVTPKVMPLNESIAATRTLLARLVGERIRIVMDLSDDAGQIKIDPGQLEHVLVNLATNARDAMPHGGTLTIRTYRLGQQVRLEMNDTGAGMDRATLDRLFEPFFTTKPNGEGTGLGLAAVRDVIEHAGGTIAVQSEPGRGATFTIDLPRNEETVVSAVQSTVPPVPRRHKPLILLVEDEPAVQLLERRVLEMGKFEVLIASCGDEALRIIDVESRSIDLLVTDVIMPGMSGRELAEMIAVRRPGIPALFLSGYTPDDTLRKGIRTEETHFLQKPFTPSALLAKVRDVLAHSPRPLRTRSFTPVGETPPPT